jgi:hypothetical protein
VLALFEQHCPALLDFTGELGDTTALHLFSGAGAFTFSLAESFQRVTAVEARQPLHQAAAQLLARGGLRVEADEQVRPAEPLAAQRRRGALPRQRCQRRRASRRPAADAPRLRRPPQGPAAALQLEDPETKQERVALLHLPSYAQLPDAGSVPEQQRRDGVLLTLLARREWEGAAAAERAAVLAHLPAAVRRTGACVVVAPEACYGQEGGIAGALEGAGMACAHREYMPLLEPGAGAADAGSYRLQLLLATVWKHR